MSEGAASDPGAGRMLVVDDDPDLLTFVETAFRQEPWSVRGVQTGERALSALAEEPADLILLDVRLPGMDGFELFRVLQDRDVDVPVIFITSHTSMESAVEAMKEGALDYLTKPLRVKPLVELVRKATREGSARGEEVYGAARSVLLEPAEGEGGGEETPKKPAPLVGRSPGMVEVFKALGRVARTDTSVLVTGETGTGKELVARHLHRNSRRNGGRFLAVNCAAIPEGLVESELFGHQKGAFTGAHEQKTGTFELAHGGTLFLDEISGMPTSLQPKLLRALEQETVRPVGAEEPVSVDARLVAASNRDLRSAVEEGDFREDLYYRLAVVEIELPPLRRRGGDVRLLADHFVRRLGPKVGREVRRVAAPVYEKLERHTWPGNVRELRNVIERALTLGTGPVLLPADLPDLGKAGGMDDGGRAPARSLRPLWRRELTLDELEDEYLRLALEEEDWNLSRAAERLGVHRSTVRRKMRDLGLRKPDAG